MKAYSLLATLTIILSSSAYADKLTPEGYFQFDVSRSSGMLTTLVIDPNACIEFGKGKLPTLTVVEKYDVMPSVLKSKLSTSSQDPKYMESLPIMACKRALGIGIAITEDIKDFQNTDQNMVDISSSEKIKMETYSRYDYDDADEDNYLEFNGITAVRVKQDFREVSIPVQACIDPNWNRPISITKLDGSKPIHYQKGTDIYNAVLQRGCLNLVEGFKLYTERSKTPNQYPNVYKVQKTLKEAESS
jgi:hypothetical protein